ncbi:MAG: endolytic transglycosylase MltG [Oscillospiraceae bacterium]|nr:endolytic transglycosylase MltG [Oscillospiraceae bacterium]
MPNSPDNDRSDFKVKFDFESKYRNVPEDRPLRLRREKRTGCVGGLLYSAFVICVSLLLASLAWIAAVDVLGFGAADEEINLTVPKEFAIGDITDMLYDAGLIKYKFLFNLYAGFSSAEEKITAGTYVLNKNFDYRALVHGMTARGGARVERQVTIPEGYTLAQIFTLLEDKNICAEDELWKTASRYDFKYDFLDKSTLGNRLRLEGFLFPNTYNFYENSTPEQAIQKMLSEFNKKFTQQYIEHAEEIGYSIYDIVTIASMIEREAGSDEERPRIAAVIYNRLKSSDFPMLEIDATIFYAIAGTGKPFSIEIDSPYNSYKNKGLPPGPIANPGLESIRAALYPESTNEYYYALNKSGTHEFFRTLEQQQAFVRSSDYAGR